MPWLFLGTGEFMYIPMKVAMHFKNALFQSSTRSPIHLCDRENYGARTGVAFNNPYDKSMINYIYNLKANVYDKIFIFFERDTVDDDFVSMLSQLKDSGVNEIYILIFTNKKELGGEQFYVEEYFE